MMAGRREGLRALDSFPEAFQPLPSATRPHQHSCFIPIWLLQNLTTGIPTSLTPCTHHLATGLFLGCKCDLSPPITIHQWLPTDFKIKIKCISSKNKIPWTLPYFSSFHQAQPLFRLLLECSFLFCALTPA